MKTPALLLLALAWLFCAPGRGLADPAGAAAITRINLNGAEVTVLVWVPAGTRRVTLESRPKLGRGNWLPRDVKWTDGPAGEITFKLPATAAETELLRVREEDEAELDLPASFFHGLKVFAPVTETVTNRGFQGGVMDGAVTEMSYGNMSLPTTTTATFTPGPTRAVVESDIWKVEGSTIYFFNQQRGLQVIDVTSPDAPKLRGFLPLAVWGEQMYRLPADTGDGTLWLALLASGGCDGNSEVLVVAVRDGQPALQHRLPVTGMIQESRMVGDALYTASYGWQGSTAVSAGNSLALTGEPRTTIAGFDLADPRNPVAREAMDVAAVPNAIQATDRWLFVATTGTRTPGPTERLPFWTVAGNQSVLIFAISDPQGSVHFAGALPTAGRVDSKFKLGLNGDVLTVVSQAGNTGRMVSRINPATGLPIEEWVWDPPRAELETFSLTHPAQPVRLGQLTLIDNQAVFGTRFEGNRVYVVTFLRVDPLWIVDLSDPTKPTVLGKLDVPGWANYLHPLGDQLLAVGVEGSRAALSLFDVKDPARPALLSKALLGEGWSWTEANNDEKALAVLPEAGLLLLPWSGTKPTNVLQWFTGMQLVDYDREAGTLRPRGVIDHSLTARRATVVGDRVVSLAGDALLAADISDRDHPQVRAELELTHQVDRVFIAGDRLIQLAYGVSPRVALASVAAPETEIASLPLLSLPVVGVDVRNGRLFVLQHQPESYRYEQTSVTNQVVTSQDQPPKEVRVTNEVVIAHPQPSLTNIIQVWRTIEYPPTPDSPGYVTNKLVWRLEITPQPDLLVTNLVVKTEWIPQPPVLTTNLVVTAEWRTIPIPAETAFSVFAWNNDQLVQTGLDRTPLPAGVAGNLLPLWVDANTLVWTEPAGGLAYPWYDVVLTPNSGVVVNLLRPIGVFPGPSWWWQGVSVRHFITYGVVEPVPKLVSNLTLSANGNWSQFSAPFAANGKVYVGERQSEAIEDPTLGNGDATIGGAWRPTRWQHNYQLHVVDFADATAPVLRPAISLPGELAGVSHGGQLLYTRLESQAATPNQPATPTKLAALAYDGISASLVDELPLTTSVNPPAVLARNNGQVLVSLPAITTNDMPAVEAWAINAEGRFSRQGRIETGALVETFHPFDEVVVAPAGGNFLFLAAGAPDTLALLGSGERTCSLWNGPETGDANAATGLWLPRGAYGIWHVPVRP